MTTAGATAVRAGVSQLGAHGFPSFLSFPLSTPFLSPFSPLSPPLLAHGSRTARARLATARARLARARSLRSRFQKKCLLPMGILNKIFQFFQTKSDFFSNWKNWNPECSKFQ